MPNITLGMEEHPVDTSQDSSDDEKEGLHLTSCKHLEKAKVRIRLDLERSSDGNQYTFKNLAKVLRQLQKTQDGKNCRV